MEISSLKAWGITLLWVIVLTGVAGIDLQFQMSGENGKFSSPNYPKNYPINMTCRWTIKTVPNSRILINFTDFKVEKNKKCLYDYLLIRDSRNGWGVISSKYCGHGSITTYLSQENNVELRFVSDKLGNVDKGFIANWQITDSRGVPVKKSQNHKPDKTTILKPCPTTTVTRAAVKCTESGVLATRVINGVKSTRCFCKKPIHKTIYRTITIQGGKTVDAKNAIKPTLSLLSSSVSNTASDNSVSEDGTQCKNEAQFDQKNVKSNTNRNIVIAFGCLLFILIVANIILVAVICRRDSSGYALYNMKTCLPRKTARPRSVEHFYSSGPRPTLRMVDGDIVVVSTNGTNAKALRHQPIEEDQSTLEMSNESQNHTQITRTDSPPPPRQKSIERTEPEIPFHLITPPEMQTATMSSVGLEEGSLTEDRRSSSFSDVECEYY